MDCWVCTQDELERQVAQAEQAVAGLGAQLRQQQEETRKAQLAPAPAQVTLLPAVQTSMAHRSWSFKAGSDQHAPGTLHSGHSLYL